jgi:hypothetical protein
LFSHANDWSAIRAGKGGLLSDYVKSIHIVQGVLYAATDKGITVMSLRKDSIAQIDKSKLPKGNLNFMKAVGETLWIAAGNNIALYNLSSGNINTVTTEESGIQNTITSIADGDNEVWIGTDGGGVFSFNRTEHQYTRISKNSGLSSDNIRTLMVFSDTLFFGTTTAGISLLNRIDERHSRLDRYDGLTNNAVTAFAQSFGRIFIGTYRGLSVLNPSKHDLRAAPGGRNMKDDLILSMAIDGRYLWLGGMGTLTRYDVRTDSSISWTKENGAPEDFITAIDVYGDRLYLATDGNGIVVFNKKVPSVKITNVEFRNRRGLIFGDVVGKDPVSQSWSFYSPLARNVVFNGGFVPNGQNNGVLAEWDLGQVIDGEYNLTLTVKDAAGVANETEVATNTDTFDPEIALDEIASYTSVAELKISGTFREKNISRIILHPGNVNASINSTTRRFEGGVKLYPGKNIVRATAYDRNGQHMELTRRLIFSDKPMTIKIAPYAKAIRERIVLISGNVMSETPVKSLTIFPGSQAVSVDRQTGAFTAQIPLTSFGQNSFVFKAEDAGKKSAEEEVLIFLDNEGPVLSIDPLPDFTGDSLITISGTINSTDLGEISISPQGTPVIIDSKRQKYSITRRLREGKNLFSITASDTLKNISQKQVTVVRDVVKPRLTPIIVPSVITLENYTINGKYDEENIATIKAEPGGYKAVIDTSSFSYNLSINLSDGDNIFSITISDKAGNSSVTRLPILARLEKQETIVEKLKKKIETLEREVDSLKKTPRKP